MMQNAERGNAIESSVWVIYIEGVSSNHHFARNSFGVSGFTQSLDWFDALYSRAWKTGAQEINGAAGPATNVQK